MDENSDLRPDLSEREKIKMDKQQAGKEIAEVAARGAGAYFGGTAGAKAVDLALKTKAGQKILDKAGMDGGFPFGKESRRALCWQADNGFRRTYEPH